MIDNRRVHLEHGRDARAGRHGNPFAAEVVVALDDDVGPELPREPPDGAGAQPPQFLAPERRRHRDPADAGLLAQGPAGRHQHVHLVPERRQPLGHRRDVDRSPLRARHGLIDG
jgi:hypothetical protein